jgi:predicted nucleotidyltransferase
VDTNCAGGLAERLGALLAPQPEALIAAYLFGSRARGDHRAHSDVDVGLLFAVPPPSTLLGQPILLADDLAGALGLPVDLIVLNTASVDLVHRVLRDGIIVLDRDRAARIRFEVRARAAYLDLAPVRARYRRAVGAS